MFINFGREDFDFEKVLFEVWIGNQLVERQEVQAPEEMLTMMFLNYVQQMAGQRNPMHLRMSGTAEIWDQYEKKRKVLPKSIDYWNYDPEE